MSDHVTENNSIPLITLIIPTRERVETLVYTLRTALDQKSTSYEIIVCDNFSQDGTAELLRAFVDPRIRYLNTGKRLSMCDNWEFALQHANGRYVIFIGDDDAVVPSGIDMLEAMIKENPRDTYMWTTATYVWPIDERKASAEYLPNVKVSSEMDLRELASFVIAHGGWRYYRVPGSYHAAVSRRIFDKIRGKTGRVFHTTQPDLFTSMAVPVFAKSCMHLAEAVTIQGRSAKSNGGASIAKDGAAVQAKFISEYGLYLVHPTLYPGAPLVANLILDAILVAMDKFPDFYSEMTFNYEAMWAFMNRLKLISRWDVVRACGSIRKYHSFRVGRFLYHLLVQDIASGRRMLLDAFGEKRESAVVPDNILDFARRLNHAEARHLS